MSPSCPISSVRVDSHLVRVISVQVALITLIVMITQFKFLSLLLFLDFLLRVFRLSNLSPFSLLGNKILAYYSVEPKYCDESPKRFALYLGLSVSFFIACFFFIGMGTLAVTFSFVLLICALLETLFDYCIGCKIYYAIQITKIKLSR